MYWRTEGGRRTLELGLLINEAIHDVVIAVIIVVTTTTKHDPTLPTMQPETSFISPSVSGVNLVRVKQDFLLKKKNSQARYEINPMTPP